MDINIRFAITARDGKLEKMMSRVPSAIRNEVVKEALRFYLRAVRDREIESDFIDAELLTDFQSNISKKIDLEDMKELLGAKAVATATINSTSTTPQSAAPVVSHDYNNISDDTNDDFDDEEEDEDDSVTNTYINDDFDDDF